MTPQGIHDRVIIEQQRKTIEKDKRPMELLLTLMGFVWLGLHIIVVIHEDETHDAFLIIANVCFVGSVIIAALS